MRFSLDDGSPAWHDAAARSGMSARWIPCPSQDAPAAPGTPVWSLRLTGRTVWGDDVERQYGSRGGILTAPEALTVTVATAEHVCQGGCGHEIAGGQLHGARMSTRYCACCITATEPESTFQTGTTAA